jgi:hypothetical protein
MSAGAIESTRFLNVTTYVVTTVGIVILIGSGATTFMDNTWPGLVIAIVGCVGLIVYAIVAIYKYLKNMKEIRHSLTFRINNAIKENHVQIKEEFKGCCDCNKPIMPAVLFIYKDEE